MSTTLTLTPTAYWHATRSSSGEPFIITGTDVKSITCSDSFPYQAEFLEFPAIASGDYHKLIESVSLTLTPYTRGDYLDMGLFDFDLVTGGTITIGQEIRAYYIINKREGGASYGVNLQGATHASWSWSASVGLTSDKILGLLTSPYLRNAGTWNLSQIDFTSLSVAFTLSDTKGTFSATASQTSGHVYPDVANTIKYTPKSYSERMFKRYTIASGVFYYKKTSESAYTSISFTGDTVTIPANTFATGTVYDAYATVVSDDNQSYTLSATTYTTEDAAPGAVALSPSNTITYGATAFTWQYSNEYGTPQYAFDLQVSSDASTWEDLQSHTVSSATSYTGTVSGAGTKYWRVRTYNQDDTASEWSNVLMFSNIVPPDAPVITLLSGNGRFTVEWTASDQIAFEIRIDGGKHLTVYTSEKSYFHNDYLSEGNHTIELRIYNSTGLVSGWTSADFSVTALAGPSASVEMQEGFNLITITPGSFSDVYILRNGTPIGKYSGTPFEDYFCNGSDIYTIRGVMADDSYGDTIIEGNYTCNRPALITPEGEILYVNRRLNTKPTYAGLINHDVEGVQYLGRSKPVHYKSDFVARSWNVTCSTEPKTGKIYFFRNHHGDRAWVIIRQISYGINDRGVHEYQFTLEETDHSEAVAYEI